MDLHEDDPGEAAEVIAELDALSQQAPEILSRLQARKRWLLAELEKVARYERMLNEYCDTAELRTASLPAACLEILRAAGRSLMLSEIHQTIRVYRPTVTIATLRTTLSRLAHKRQVLACNNAEGRSTYRVPEV